MTGPASHELPEQAHTIKDHRLIAETRRASKHDRAAHDAISAYDRRASEHRAVGTEPLSPEFQDPPGTAARSHSVGDVMTRIRRANTTGRQIQAPDPD